MARSLILCLRHRDTFPRARTRASTLHTPAASQAHATDKENDCLETPLSLSAQGPARLKLTQKTKPKHPTPALIVSISDGLKKLRANNMQTKIFRPRYLWRGMRNLQVGTSFMLDGGTELACMSTSSNLDIVAKYADSKAPLLLRLRVDSPMEMGADISWLSIFPGEKEVLYPPLTFLKPLFQQAISGTAGVVVTVKPAFPS